MPNYRRAYVPGGSFFFTVVTYRRKPVFRDPAAVNLLRSSMRRVQNSRPFRIDAIVVLPDHLHAIWTLPERDDDFAMRWSLIKRYVSSALPGFGTGPADPSRRKRREPTVWQRRYWEHLIQDEDDLRRHVDYIHYNPVKHGVVKTPADWPYSSFRRAVARGDYPADWGKQVPEAVLGMECE